MYRSSGLKYRMENLMDDALNIQKLLPWIESDEDIINFMRRVPLDQTYLRKQVTIYHFLKKQDEEEDDFEQQIEDDAREIVIMMPDVPYKEIKERLCTLGKMPCRKEVVLRQLLFNNKDVERVLYEMYFNSRNKRKSINVDPDTEDLNNSETNINIKIRRVEGALEVVSSIKQEAIPSPQLNRTDPKPQVNQEMTSNKNVLQLPHSSMLLPANTYPKPCTAVCDTKRTGKDLYKMLNQDEESMSSSDNSESTEMSNPLQEVMVLNDDTVPAEDINNHIVSEQEKQEQFDLVQYLKEVTQADERKVMSVCQKYNIALGSKPSLQMLNILVNAVIDDKDDLIVVDDSKANILSDWDDSGDETFKEFISEVNRNENSTTINPNAHQRDPPSHNPSGPDNKESIPKNNIIAPAKFIAGNKPPEPLNLSSPKNSILQPARLLPPLLGQLLVPKSESALPISDTFPKWETVPVDVEMAPSTSNGTLKKKRKILDEKLVFRLMEMFPEACPDYIRNVCDGKDWAHFDDVVTIILSNEDHPKRPQKGQSPPILVSVEDQLEIVKALLPDADPTYLRCKVEAFGSDPDRLNEFIVQANESKSYPTMKEYLRKQKLTAQSKQYTSEFSVENFVQLFPEPEKTFNDPKRTVKLDNYTSLYIITYFQNKFDTLSVRVIRSILSQQSYRIVPSNNILLEELKANRTLKKKRKRVNDLNDIPQNIAVLQELAYLTHQQEIERYIEEKVEKEERDRQYAKENNLMNTCRCCFDEEMMPKDTFCCQKECMFCRECIKKSCEVALGQGKTVFKCLADCDAEFTLQTLQTVLPPKMFSKLAQKKTVAEAQAAGIAELESCPFCDFASIPNENDKIFHCLNADCMKESCRLCQQENHIPYKCDEVEMDADVQARVYVENKMTEALLRKCWKCGMSFFKEEGCNKMTCTCGAKMCYICKSRVTDYSHFNGIGGDKHHLCPLYSDSNAINQQNVIGAAQAAKAEVDPARLKVDPTADIQQHYAERKKVLPREPHLELINLAVNHAAGHNHGHHHGHQHVPQPVHQHVHHPRHQPQARILHAQHQLRGWQQTRRDRVEEWRRLQQERRK